MPGAERVPRSRRLVCTVGTVRAGPGGVGDSQLVQFCSDRLADRRRPVRVRSNLLVEDEKHARRKQGQSSGGGLITFGACRKQTMESSRKLLRVDLSVVDPEEIRSELHRASEGVKRER